ncbi:MAG: APC family permease [Candidatus Aenigmatarchaeota archaeon]
METKLKRELEFLEVTLCGIGIILGAGIYVLIGKVIGVAGNAAWLSFFISALMASLTGLSYAELSSMFPKAGAEYVYTKKAFGQTLAFLIGWLILLSGIVGGATVAMGFSEYFTSIIKLPKILLSILVVYFLSFIIFSGIKESAKFMVLSTILEVFGLLLIIFIGLPFFGSVNYFEFNPEFGISGIFSGAALIFFAYLGFEEIVKLSEETKRAETIIPKALLFSIAITTLIYILVAISVVSIPGIKWDELNKAEAPLSLAASKIFGKNGFLVVWFISLFSTANTCLFILLAASRIMYGMATENTLPKIFSKVHKKRKTPYLAILFVAVLSSLFTLSENIKLVAGMTNLSVFLSFFVINSSLIWLRIKRPEIKRKFKIPFNIGRIPVLTVFSLLFCSFMIFQLEFSTILLTLAVAFPGLFYSFLRKKFK